jgi:hypothetical protein
MDFKLESQDKPNKEYILKNLTFESLQKKNKGYKQFDNTLKISDVISNKIKKIVFFKNRYCSMFKTN